MRVPCPYQIRFSTEEQESLEWLEKTLHNIYNKPGHRNREKAALAIIALDRVYEHVEKLHDELHSTNRALAAMTQLKTQKRGQA